MSGSLIKWIQYLGDSELTAKFQKLCGIRIDENFAETNGEVANNNRYDAKNIQNGKVASKTNGFSDVCNHNGSLIERKHISGVDQNHSYTNGASKNIYQDQLNKSRECCQLATSVLKNGQTTKPVHYTIHNTILYWLFSFGASLGNEGFYTLFFSASVWSFDSFVLRKTLILWIVNFYIGQVAKDVFKWSRPKSPPVVRLEERYELEYGMPSTHAMAGFVLPFGMLYYMTDRYQFCLPLGLTVAVLWCLLVCCSRIYLGMHSVLDVIAGVLLASLLMVLTIPFVDPVDTFIISHPLSMPGLVAASLVLSLAYPRIDSWSTTRGDTIQALGVFSGLVESLWLMGQLKTSSPTSPPLPMPLALPSLGGVGLALLRQVIGVPIVLTVLIVAKTSILYATSWCLGLDPKNPETKKRFLVELPYKFGQFFASCGLGAFLAYLLFSRLNIDRPEFYSECLSYST